MTVPPSTPPTKQPSPFAELSPKYTSEQIAANLSAEIKRLHHRKQLQYPGSSPSATTQCTAALSSSSAQAVSSSETAAAAAMVGSCNSPAVLNTLSPIRKDVPLFTFRQVALICERMVKEREEQLREMYDKVLTTKMAEQYEAFLKFNHDQIRRGFSGSEASYVS